VLEILKSFRDVRSGRLDIARHANASYAAHIAIPKTPWPITDARLAPGGQAMPTLYRV
jgi:hypothetical protein